MLMVSNIDVNCVQKKNEIEDKKEDRILWNKMTYSSVWQWRSEFKTIKTCSV